MPSLQIKASSNIAVVWGTKNSVLGNTLAGAICETLTLTPKNASPIDIEDGDGFAAIQVGLDDGFDAKSSHVYDSNKAMPVQGDTVVLVGPKNDGNAGTKNYNCTFWSWGATRSRKKEKMVDFTYTYRPNIN